MFNSESWYIVFQRNLSILFLPLGHKLTLSCSNLYGLSGRSENKRNTYIEHMNSVVTEFDFASYFNTLPAALSFLNHVLVTLLGKSEGEVCWIGDREF